MNNKLEDEQRRRRGLKRSGPIVTTKVGRLGNFFYQFWRENLKLVLNQDILCLDQVTALQTNTDNTTPLQKLSGF